jgi:FkbM family methyltransferase
MTSRGEPQTRIRRSAMNLKDVAFGPHLRQRLFQRLHAIALKGLGVGEGDVRASGELELLRWLANTESIQVVVDVGANVGEYSDFASRLLPEARVFSIEPAMTTFRDLEKRLGSRPNVRCARLAISSVRGNATLHHVRGLSGLSSLTQRDLLEHGIEQSHVETVPTLTLDEFADQQEIRDIDVLKIDVEGHEMEVLTGAQGLIGRRAVANIQFEFGGANIDSRTYLRDFVRLLTPHYDLFRVPPSGRPMPFRYNERQEIFVTTNYLARLRDR